VGVSAMGYLSEARVHLIIAIWLILVGLPPISVFAEDSTDAALQFYAVQVLHTSEQSPAGAGIYLGKGLVITAAHITGSNQIGVRFDGVSVPARVLKRGALQKIDLALYAVRENDLPTAYRSLSLPLCETPPQADAPVIVVTPPVFTSTPVTHSRMLSTSMLTLIDSNRWPTIISDVETDGRSGSGVFDSQSKCLLGILSAKLNLNNNNTHKAIGTYFVSASVIRPFVADATAKGTASGTSANGRPIGAPGSGRGSPENPY
jgi:hypothetical protein